MKRVWEVLEIPRGSDRDTIRRAYAKKLRVTNPEDDPEGFKRLREAYEAALQQHDYAARWAAIEDDDGSEDAASEAPPSEPASRTMAPGARSAEAGQPAEPEIDAPLAAREGELAQLRAAMADLEAGLRGPWHPADTALEERLDAILRSPVMAELGTRADVERWLADLLAATIPHSDAVLLQSAQAFGWGSDDHHVRGVAPAIGMLLGRLDEWRIIEGLNHHSHAYHPAWRSLTQRPGPWWSWRLNAFRPGMIAGVETLLGERGSVAPGLHYSFNADAVERWRRFLAKPRLTLGILALLPVACLALFWLGYAALGAGIVDQGYAIAAIAAIGFATPAIALFSLSRWQRQWRARDTHPAWLRDGWLAAFAALAVLAMALPGPWPLLVALPAVGIAAWTYIVAPPATPGALRLGGGVASCAALAFFSLAPLSELHPPEAFALGILAILLTYLRLLHWATVRSVLMPLLWRQREWIILGATIAGLALAIGVFVLRTQWQPVLALYPVGLAAMALLPLVGSPDRGEGPPRWIARTILVVVFLWAYGASIPPAKQGDRTPGTTAESTAMPVADSVDRAERTLLAMERQQPGFDLLRKGNPALHARIREVIGRLTAGQLTQDQADREIADLVNGTYRRMMPDAPSDLLVESLRLRLERQRALRDSAPAACVSPKPNDGTTLPEALAKRQNALIYTVISTPPASAAEKAAGHVISGAAQSARVAAALHLTPAALVERFEGAKGPAAACDVRIAVTQALLDNRLDDIAATMRRDYRALRDREPAPRPDAGKAPGRALRPRA